ncbi:MAG: PAS domain S-box protein, partial [Candidatus Aegiribacteria sp.]|nr:PAS domain S-box protein [Candidatus Aegiribacteria sp.]MBD3293942.1 PAS domain S-box protein [Candidatus Fermentibacteria bacterium]
MERYRILIATGSELQELIRSRIILGMGIFEIRTIESPRDIESIPTDFIPDITVMETGFLEDLLPAMLKSVKKRWPQQPLLILATESSSLNIEEINGDTPILVLLGDFKNSLPVTLRRWFGLSHLEGGDRYNPQWSEKMINSLPVGYYVTEQDGNLIYANEALKEMMGLSDPDSIKNLAVSTCYANPDDQRKWREIAHKKGFVKGFETKFLRPDNSEMIWVRDSATVIKDFNGEPFMFEGILEDITQQKDAERKLELQQTYFRQLFENSTEAILLVDNSDTVMNTNRAFEETFGYSKEDAVGKKVNDLIVPPDLQSEASGMSNDVLDGVGVFSESVRMHKDGSLVDVAIRGYPITLKGRQIGVFGIYHDISARMRAERRNRAIYAIAQAATTTDSLEDLLN